jgi:hypothetical protein
MRRPSALAAFLGVFALVYGALVVPWPSWRQTYAAYFRGFCGLFLARESTDSIVRFRPAPPGAPLDLQIVLVNPHIVDAVGRAKARVLGLDTRGVGWIPTAFLVALILATAVPWRRRLGSLGLGLLLLHGYLLAAVRVYIWHRSMPELAAGAPASLLRWVAAGLEETMVTQLGPSFVVPAAIWILVTFRLEDLEAARDWLGLRPDPAASAGGD